jgi:hypothetical protein
VRAEIRRSSVLSCIALAMGIFACLLTCVMDRPKPARPGEGDGALYRAIYTRVHEGQNYYDAAHAQLQARHYGLRSVLNWRVPTLTYLLAVPPSPIYARLLLIVISLVAILLAVNRLKEGGLSPLLVLVFLLLGSLLSVVFIEAVVFSELWAGVLILLSILLYPRHRLLCTLAGLAALFLRELAAVYVLILLMRVIYDSFSAESSRRRLVSTPGAVLMIGLFIYTLIYLWHFHQVQAHILADDPGYPSGYMQLLGLPFLLSAARQNIWLMLLPMWVTAIYLPVCVYGMFSLPKSIGQLVIPTVLAYLALFAIAAKPFNDYWGLMISPLLAISLPAGMVKRKISP